MSAVSRHYVLAAGGTGGHLIPAFALAVELERRGHHVALITDERGAKLPGKPHSLVAHVLPAGRLGKNPLHWPKGVEAILREKIANLIAGNKLVPMVDDLAKKAWDKYKTDYTDSRMAELVGNVIRSSVYGLSSANVEDTIKEEVRSRLDGYLKAEAASSINVAMDRFVDRSLKRR